MPNLIISINLHIEFQSPYIDTISIMLRVLSTRIKDKIHSDKDLQLLYTKIIKLNLKVSKQSINMKEAEMLISNINRMRELTSNEDIKSRAHKFQ